MNKDKQEDKVKIESVRQAIGILVAGIDTGLVEVPKYEPRDLQPEEAHEDLLMEEMLFMVHAARKDVRRKRIRLFFVGVFFIPFNIRKTMKQQYKESAQAYRYLLRHKKELRTYMSKVKLGIMDPKSSWLDPCYSCGENVQYRVNERGVVERNVAPFGASPDYKPLEHSCVFREPAPGIVKIPKRTDVTRWAKMELSNLGEDDRETLRDRAMTAAMAASTEMLESFKGRADFRTQFKRQVDSRLRELGLPLKELQGDMKWVRWLSSLMDSAWKKRLECTENSKNSSKQKEEDSQS
jgi:hypothetical protein